MLRKTLKVGAYRYRMIERKSPPVNNGHECYGTHDANLLEIEYSTDPPQHPTHIKATLWHEAVHAICHDRGIELSEADVDQMACGLNALMVDNNVEFWELPDKPKKAIAK
jgi:hypothetical protein